MVSRCLSVMIGAALVLEQFQQKCAAVLRSELRKK